MKFMASTRSSRGGFLNILLGLVLCSDGSSELFAADSTPPPAGLVGWWKGDGSAVDIVAGNNGTLANVAFTNGIV